MRTLAAFLLIIPFFASASSGSEFVGKWVHIKYQSSRIEISENDANYLITELRENRTKKYVAQLSEGALVVNTGPGAATIGLEKATGNLLYGGQEYRRLKNGESFEYTRSFNVEVQ